MKFSIKKIKESTHIFHENCKPSNEIKCKNTIPENSKHVLGIYFKVIACLLKPLTLIYQYCS